MRKYATLSQHPQLGSGVSEIVGTVRTRLRFIVLADGALRRTISTRWTRRREDQTDSGTEPY